MFVYRSVIGDLGSEFHDLDKKLFKDLSLDGNLSW